MRTITSERNGRRTVLIVDSATNRILAEVNATIPKPSAADQATMRHAIANLQSLMARR